MEKHNSNNEIEWCPEADLNHRHADFQQDWELWQLGSTRIDWLQ
jgi:hypothetical protein